MTFEERCIAHYGPIHRRLAHPPKRPIVMPLRAEEPPKKRRQIPGNNRHRATLHAYDDAGIKRMRRDGVTMAEVAAHYNIPVKAMETYIRKHKPRWESEA